MDQNMEYSSRRPGGDDMLRPDLVHIFGHRESLKLDDRMRFRLPDHLARAIAQEMGRVSSQSNLSPAARQNLAFYFVPGTGDRVFLYPTQNIQVAVQRFESPPPGVDRSSLRAARDYFYSMMEFVEADRQNRLQIPSHLCEHARIGEKDNQVVVVAHNLWLSVSGSEAASKLQAGGRKAFDSLGPEVLDPVQFAGAKPEGGE